MNIRRINRGIALGCVLAVGTVSYVVYDHKQFSKGQDDIKSTIEQYLHDISTVQVIKDQQKSLDAYKNVVDKYWISGNDWFNEDANVFDKSGLMDGWDTVIKDWNPTGYFEKCEIKTGDISISKYGNDGAYAVVAYDVYSEFYGSPLDFSGGYVTTVNSDTYDNNGDRIIYDVSDKYKNTKEYFSTEFYLEKVDGSWRIVGAAGWWYNNNNLQKLTSDESKAVDDKTEDSATDSDKKAGVENE
ncbi:MAG: hypothetical protein K2F81_02290 [Ruminococcus sp.]|nr:hypothetical protein [Ruminococcus sp.]